MSAKVFPEDTGIWISELSKADGPSWCGWASSTESLKETKHQGRETFLCFCLTAELGQGAGLTSAPLVLGPSDTAWNYLRPSWVSSLQTKIKEPHRLCNHESQFHIQLDPLSGEPWLIHSTIIFKQKLNLAKYFSSVREIHVSRDNSIWPTNILFSKCYLYCQKNISLLVVRRIQKFIFRKNLRNSTSTIIRYKALRWNTVCLEYSSN